MLTGPRIATACLVAAFGLAAFASKLPSTDSPQGHRSMIEHAKGQFDVTVTPVADDISIGDPSIGRFVIAKQFHGDIEGASKGQMLGMRDGNSGGYVAIERVTATVLGRHGSFALQHNGTMHEGNAAMDVQIVPGSGTEGFTGITGQMAITQSGGTHHYELSYSLPAGG